MFLLYSVYMALKNNRPYDVVATQPLSWWFFPALPDVAR